MQRRTLNALYSAGSAWVLLEAYEIVRPTIARSMYRGKPVDCYCYVENSLFVGSQLKIV